ncbi:Sterol desaturase/sphingolipid hydroxylase, fatty acid hydroxylase superfamily [Saccharicrinis carchari]|uniref:Sterol desaturase/sphingolipid hydroxylase, fatty acid hydroxylase superfamily n=1 Tax=Saccharicrinis carchari TaxID=1168039 RepID=A0A521F511_SACCC|nr:sterol desaturase family protein [Saccharicrinis carchari]SMO91268.1 Sterol desaturase/sphingolipid hydroxylase, fatty acid hydroxylase superfamily [Saccharicrinis carchari]
MEDFISQLPTPFEILSDPISLIVYALLAGLLLWEAIFPARELPRIRFWRLRGSIFFLAFVLFTTYIPLLWDGFFAQYQLMDLSSLNLISQVLLGIFVFELVQYCWHISMHKSDFLFRVSHQIHHSAERIDVPSTFMFSINDMIGLSLVGSVSFALIMGLAPQAITIIILTTSFLGIFQHANINTPRWIGYLVQRPESHNVHHAKGIHKYNYTDLPLIDMMFGTFRNPKSYGHETGYYLGASNKVLDMLLFKDVTKQNHG